MGYTFRIGNAIPTHSKECFPELTARWEVEAEELGDAPTFPNDDMTGKSNMRSPSYTAWADFCRAVGLYDFFYDDRGHLLAGHPGCVGITQADADMVSAALRRYRREATLPPGFQSWDDRGPATHDANLARLIWLEFWMQWAVKNCETPAIQNT